MDIPPLVFPESIDNSMLSSFKRCPRHWYWETLRAQTLKGGNVHLTTGGAFAAGLEAARRAYYERNLPPDDAVALGLEALIRFYGEADFGPSKKSFDRLFLALIDYFIQYPLDQDPFVPRELIPGKRAIEFTFAIPLPINHPDTSAPLLYTGRFDALGLWKDVPFGLDDKTASQLGPQWTRNWILDSQFTGYSWAAREYGQPLAGFLIRGVSFLADRFGHAQAVVYRPNWMLDRWYETTLHTIKMMLAFFREGHFPLVLDKHSCNSYGGCAFHQLCESQHPERWLTLNYEPRVWDPLAKGAA